MKTLMDQLGELQTQALGLLVGVDVVGAAFCAYLRQVPALPDDFTIGDAARAYLQARLDAVNALSCVPRAMLH